ncbi:MAG: helix-turn-helix transcriptional regulator, partial [Lachnospiraceae bacterium]|nr:helix-turn-helix transcriptional regulator [Lachnospiraceae bacterium]
IYISDLAGQVNLNEQYFCRLFKKAIGYSPIAYINEYRIKQAKRLLEETDLQVTEVCLESGFNNFGNFLQEFRRHTGTTPLQYRKHMELL